MLRSEITASVLKQQNGLVSAVQRKSSTYVCPACQFARTRGLRSITSSLPRTTRTNRYEEIPIRSTSIRRFTTTRIARSTVQPSQESSNNEPAYNFSVKHDLSHKKSKTPIRDSLRMWSVQNEVSKRQNAPTDVPAEGRITQLPNALFLKNAGEVIEEDTSYITDTFGDEDMGESMHMEPGTLFSHHGTSVRQYAVYLGTVGVQAQLVLQTGKWSLERLRATRNASSGGRRAVIPNFLTTEEVAQMKQCVPKEAIQRSSVNGNEKSDVPMQGLVQGPQAASILGVFLSRMRKFTTEVEEFDRLHGAQIDAVYDKVAHEEEWRFISLEDFTRSAGHDYNTMKDTGKMALLNRINDLDHLVFDNNANSITILCCSKDLKRRMSEVVEWAREYQDAAVKAALGKDVAKMLRANPLTSFIDKARRLIVKSRKIRAPTTIGCLGPTSGDKDSLRKITTDEEFSDTDKSLIDFVWNACFRKPRPLPNGTWKMMPITSLILRAVGAYPSLALEAKVGRLFLKELGCADPWAGRNSFDLTLPLPGGRASHRVDARASELMAAGKQFSAAAQKHKGIPPDMDTMAHMRKDWGSLTALAVDPETTEIVEDAISIEKAQDTPNGYWIHVHVTHVTSCFDPDSVVSRYARHQGSACFVIDGSLPVGMVPRAINDTFSLQSGSPVLTISTLITEDGQVHDTKVSAGTIRSFERIDRRAVDHILGVEDSEDDLAVLVVGKVPRVKREPVDQKAIQKALLYKETFETIYRLTQARLKRRRTEMPIAATFETSGYGSGVSTTMTEYKTRPDREHHSYHWRGDPGIVLTGKRKFANEVTDEKRSNDVVTQTMRLAAESAGKWLTQRNIPAVFLGTQASPGNPISKLSKAFTGRQTLAPLFVRSSSPLPYWNINIKAYTLCTSPLRRYMDMLACYQMDSYLKAEASGAVQPGAPIKDQSLLAFTGSDVNDYVNTDAGAADTIDLVTRAGKVDYAFQALFRAFHFKEADLPEIWEIVIEEPFKYSAAGTEVLANGKLIPFGLDVKVLSSPQGWDKLAGYHQFLPVKIDMVDPDQLIVHAKPVGPPTQTQMIHDPIQAWSEDNILQDTTVEGSKISTARPL